MNEEFKAPEAGRTTKNFGLTTDPRTFRKVSINLTALHGLHLALRQFLQLVLLGRGPVSRPRLRSLLTLHVSFALLDIALSQKR